jgi:CubicO group peptidase (beta-lactamase class C family)
MKYAWIGMALASTVSLHAADIAEIRSIMANRVESGRAVGIVTGVIDEKGRQVIASGKVSLDSAQQPDGDTIYEIGSVTKVFTSLILADMIEKAEVRPDDPVSKFLPATVKVPSRNGRQITLLDLSMQVSGLPRLPDNMKPADPANPYADYDAAKLYDFLSRYTLTRDPGEKYEYSNLAVGLLGHALALKAGMPYEELLRRRIFDPLGMTSTSIALSETQKKRFAQAGQELGSRCPGRLRRGALHGKRYAEIRRGKSGTHRYPAQIRHAPHAVFEEVHGHAGCGDRHGVACLHQVRHVNLVAQRRNRGLPFVRGFQPGEEGRCGGPVQHIHGQ